jgi:hypothetical protein
MLFFSDGFSVSEGFMAVKCKKTNKSKIRKTEIAYTAGK